MADRYQDYVVKDGKFVGKFEEMYSKFADPWHQSGAVTDFSTSRNSAILFMQKYGIKSALEMGCGLGYFSKMIQVRTGAVVTGMDISPTAIEKARASFPGIDFQVGDITDSAQILPQADAILLSEITWYILPHLSETFTRLLSSHSGKYFIHNLVFYKGEQQKYGRDFFSKFDEFVKFCPFTLLESSLSTQNDSDSTVETSAIFRIEQKQLAMPSYTPSSPGGI